MSKLLNTTVNLVIKASLSFVALGLLTLVSFYTPIFSTAGLWILNHLPIPKINHQTDRTYPANFRLNQDFFNPPLEDTPTALDLQFKHEPTAYVVLGGGLTEAGTYHDDYQDSKTGPNKNSRQIKSSLSSGYLVDQNDSIQRDFAVTSSLHPPSYNNIVLNKYTLSRMQTVIQHQRIKPLPIVLTGVDAPWMEDWLVRHGIHNIITENASMNTCENARFTAKRLNLKDVYLITDAYHMTRARRQFALNGIHALPIPAELPMSKGWLAPENNAQHSRRTIYELAAYTRDVFAPQDNCREASEVSFDTLLRSRKPKDIKTF